MLYHAVRPLPATPPCASLGCVRRVLDDPLVTRVPVLDDAGTQYAVDLAPTQGTLLALAGFVLLQWLVAVLEDRQ